MPPPPVGIELVSTCRMHSITYANLMIKRCSTMPIWMLDRPKNARDNSCCSSFGSLNG